MYAQVDAFTQSHCANWCKSWTIHPENACELWHQIMTRLCAEDEAERMELLQEDWKTISRRLDIDLYIY